MPLTIPLVCGDPAGEEPASFTRFVLPFGYQLEAGGARKGPAWQVETAAVSPARQRYFTTETSRVLFRRARRFVLQDLDAEHRSFAVPRRDGRGEYRVAIATPRLVLFEWRKAQPGAGPDRDDVLATGFLLLDLFFPDVGKAPDLDELLELNEVFRHCVPPFEDHVRDGPEAGGRRGLATVLGDLPVDLCEAAGPRVRDRRDGEPLQALYFERWAALLDRPVEHGGERWRLFPGTWAQRARSWYHQPLPETDDGTGWVVYADSRAFVWTCALLGDGVDTLRRMLEEPAAHAADLGHWVKLLNVDAPGSEPASATGFERCWARERTYERWQEQGTAYGFSYHSGALLGPPLTEPAIWRHFSDLYFDQTLLLLYLRVSSFRFSRRLSEVTECARGSGGPEQWQHDFRALRRDFAFFTNLYQFPLLSNQQQGVELYALARRHLDVGALFEEIRSEVESTHAFIEMVVAHDHSRTATRLTVVATAGLLLSVVVGFFGMNILAPDRASGLGIRRELVLFLLGVVVAWAVLASVNLHATKFDRAFRFWRKQD
jgi:hypothetical protein